MIWQYVPYSTELIATIIIFLAALIVVYATSRLKKFWRIRFFIVLGSLFWIVMKYLELGFIDTEIKLLLSKIQLLSFFIVPAAILIFSLYYSGREKWVNKTGIFFLCFPSAVAGIMLMTNNFQGLIIREVRTQMSGSFLILEKDFGTGYWIIVSYSVLLILFGVIFMNKTTRASGNKFQWQSSIAILVLLLFPILIVLLSLMGYDPYPHLEIVPYTIACGSMLVSTIMYRRKDEEVVDVDNSNIVDSMKDGIILLNMRDNILYINKTFQKFFDRDFSEMVGQKLSSVFPGLNKKLEAIEGGDKTGRELRVSGDKTEKIYNISLSGLFNWQKILIGRTIVIRDVTGQKIAEGNLKNSEIKYRLLFENSIDGIYRGDLEGSRFDINTAFARILGYENRKDVSSEYIQNFLRLFKENLASGIKTNNNMEALFKKANGDEFWMEMTSSKDRDQSGEILYTVIIRDITSRKISDEKIKYLSFHDKTTTLYNRAFFEEEIKRLDKKRQLPLSVVIADVDGLKVINDNFGHKRGDMLLQKIAGILKSCFRGEDIIARYGGDEFGVLLPTTNIEEASKVFERIKLACIKESTRTLPLSISLGVACKVEMSQDINSLIKEADKQMYKDKLLKKQNKKDSRIYSLQNTPKEKDFETIDTPVR